MQNFYTVIQQYEDSNPDPIILNTGDVVQLGEEYKEDAAWPNWIRCISKKTGKSGWTPLQILQINGETAVATTNYTAKEMTVTVGDVVTGHHELNGWLWCVRASEKQNGWVPKNCLKLIE